MSAASCGRQKLLDARARAPGRRDRRRGAAPGRGRRDRARSSRCRRSSACRAITDGEFRRTYFHIDFLLQLDGRRGEAAGSPVKFHKQDGEVDFAPPVLDGDRQGAAPKPIQRADFEFLEGGRRSARRRSRIPSPTMLHFRGGRAGDQRGRPIPTWRQFFADVGRAYREEIADLAEAGCRYLQLDDTNLAYLCDDTHARGRAAARRRSRRAAAPLRRLINDAIREPARRHGAGVHLCRGNFRSRLGGGGRLRAGRRGAVQRARRRRLISSNTTTPRSGDFAPLRFLPKGKTVVLGLVTTKLGELESKDELKRRIDEAARDRAARAAGAVARNAASPSTVHGNDIAVEQQAREAPPRRRGRGRGLGLK